MLHLLTVLFVLISPAGPIREGSTKGSQDMDSIQKLQLQTVDVLAEKKTSTPDLQRLDVVKRFEHSGTPMARQLEAVPGMSVLSSGTQLAKPVINGLHSQRILILQDSAVCVPGWAAVSGNHRTYADGLFNWSLGRCCIGH